MKNNVLSKTEPVSYKTNKKVLWSCQGWCSILCVCIKHAYVKCIMYLTVDVVSEM